MKPHPGNGTVEFYEKHGAISTGIVEVDTISCSCWTAIVGSSEAESEVFDSDY